MKVSKVKTFNVELTEFFTDAFRSLIKKEIGYIDTAHSFMYLFNRFGVPNERTKDDYKIAYAYNFACGECLISVHASGRTHVYFNFYAPKHIFDNALNERYEKEDKITKRLNSLGIPFISDILDFCIDEDSSDIDKQNISLAIDCLTEDEKYAFEFSYEKFSQMCNTAGEEAAKKKYSELKIQKQQAIERLCALKELYLTNEEQQFLLVGIRKPFNLQFEDYPEIQKAAEYFIADMLKPIKVRDIHYNIKEYLEG